MARIKTFHIDIFLRTINLLKTSTVRKTLFLLKKEEEKRYLISDLTFNHYITIHKIMATKHFKGRIIDIF